MSAKGIRAGKAFVELGVSDKLTRGLRKAQQRLKAFGSAVNSVGVRMLGLGTAGLAPLLGAAKVFSSFGDQVAKMAKRTGLSVETLSELRFVASQTGTEFASLEMGFRRMQRSIYDAGRGLSTAMDALTDLGLKFEDLDGLSPEQQFKKIGGALGRIEDPTKKAAIAMTLFGRTGTNLLPMFAMGAAGIEKLQKEARRLGLTMSSEDAKAAEEFTDILDALWKTVKMAVFQVGAALAPTLGYLAKVVTGVVTKIIAWIKINRDIVVTVAKFAAGVVAAGGALIGIGAAVQVLAFAFGGLTSIVSGIGMVFGLLLSALGALVSPLGLVSTAVVGLGSAFLVMSGAGGKALDWLMAQFGRLRDFVGTVLGGITDALVAGNIMLAAKVLWSGLKVVWLTGIEPLQQAWNSFRYTFERITIEAFESVKIAWIEVSDWMWQKFPETTAFIAKTWANLGGVLRDTWARFQNWLSDRWLEVMGMFDENLDVDLAKQLGREDLNAQLAQIESDRQAAVAEAERKSKRTDAEREREKAAALGEVERQRMAALSRLNTESASRVKEAEQALAAAKAELDKAVKQAKEERGSANLSGTIDDVFEKIKNQLDNLTNQPNSAIAAGGGVYGTFNPAAIRGVGSSRTTIEKLTAIERNTGKIATNTEDGGFGP